MKVMAIGLGTHSRHQTLWMENRVPEDIHREIAYEEADEYDMTSWPERGDAVVQLRKELYGIVPRRTRAVVAFHLYGMHPTDSEFKYTSGHYYNKHNGELLPLCRALGIPLYVFGDQPEGGSSFQAYLPKTKRNPQKPVLGIGPFLGLSAQTWFRPVNPREEARQYSWSYGPTDPFDVDFWPPAEDRPVLRLCRLRCYRPGKIGGTTRLFFVAEIFGHHSGKKTFPFSQAGFQAAVDWVEELYMNPLEYLSRKTR